MKHIRLLIAIFFGAISIAVSAQEVSRTITGKVLDSNGNAVIGAGVVIKGTTIGTITDANGSYSINAPANSQLVISCIGYKNAEVSTGNNSVVNVTLEEDSELLSEVVVTALGIKREKKALGYSMQEVKTDDFLENRATSVSNLLQGKVAGVQISQSASGVGGPTRVILRGLNSISGNNSPLWVVDGLPVLDNSNGNTQFAYSSGAADINPDDIESISVLKGANAAALYGSRAQNGAIIITTKKGHEGELQMEYNGYISFSKAYDTYEFQNEYGQGTNGVFTIEATGSWGPKMTGQTIPNWRNYFYNEENYEDYAMLPQKNIIEDFYRTATNYTNSLSATAGNEKLNARFSFTDSRNKGITPNESMNKQNYNITAQMNGKFLSITGKVAYFREKVYNRPETFYDSIWSNLIRMPRNIRLQDLKNPLGINGYVENWHGEDTEFRNPYQYLLDGNGNKLNRDRFQGQITATATITDWMKVTGRIGLDRISDDMETYAAYHQQAQNPANLKTAQRTNNSELNADLMANIDKRFKDFSITANFGVATNYISYKSLMGESGTAIIPNFVAISNGEQKLATEDFSEKRVNSILGNATIGYKGLAYLDLTARNDWSSTLPKSHWSYFYPSASLSGILSEIFNMPDDYFLKIRGSIAQVGNDTDPYQLYNVYTLGTIGTHTIGSSSDTYPNSNLKPEETVSWEVGTEYHMFTNRLSLDFTYYNSTTKNQIMSMTVPSSSGYGSKLINAGKMRSKGVELMISGTPILTNDWRWDITLNWGKNETRNVKLDEKNKRYIFPLTNNVRVGSVVIDEGGKFGDIVSTAYKRNEDGRILVSDSGLPLIDTGSEKVIGNMLPDWTGSISTNLSWRDLSMSALIDIRYGGDFLSMTDAYATGAGNSKRTLEGRDGMVVDGIVESTGEENTKQITAQEYYATIAGTYPVGEEFLYKGTYVKLRELSFGYKLPQKWFVRTPIKSVKVSLVGRDLFNIYKDAPVNPEYAQNSQDVFQAFELAALPSTRTFGFSLNVKF